MEDLTEYHGKKQCPICNRIFWVIWPNQYVFRRRNSFFCSWSCMRIYDKREDEKPVQKVSLEQKKKAVQIAINGEDPRPYLKECGSRNADLMWGKIREKLKEADPEMFAQLPDKIPRSDKGKPRNEPEVPEVTTGTTERRSACRWKPGRNGWKRSTSWRSCWGWNCERNNNSC